MDSKLVFFGEIRFTGTVKTLVFFWTPAFFNMLIKQKQGAKPSITHVALMHSIALKSFT